MSFTGHMADGKVVFDAPVPLPDGTPVRVEPTTNGVAPAAAPPPRINPRTGRPYPSYLPRELAEKLYREDTGQEPPAVGPSLSERLKPLTDSSGQLDLPTDGAANVDHYLYGHPKKS